MFRPAGGSFSGEMATNRGSTSLAFAGKYVGDWPDGVEAPIFPSDGGCIGQPLSAFLAPLYRMVLI